MKNNKLFTCWSLALLITMLVITGAVIAANAELRREMERLQIEKLLLEAENDFLRDKLEELRKKQAELRKRIEEWLDDWEMGIFELTFYTRKCGYPWNDGITYLGYEATPGRTIAVDPEVIPFHSWVWIEGFGWRRAEDIGPAIKGNRIDYYVGEGPEAHREAMRLGRQQLKVVYQKQPGKE